MSYTIVHRTPLDADKAHVRGLSRVPFEEGLFKTVSLSATLESPAIETPFPFDDLVGSWNAKVPRGATLTMEVRVRGERGWSPWFELGRAEGEAFYSPGRQENETGAVDVDTLKLKEKASAFRYRFAFKAGRRSVRLRLVSVTVSDDSAPLPAAFEEGPWVRELKAPPRSQTEEQEKYRHDICSPTSLAMALDYWGIRRKTVDVAERARDRATGLFGVWPANAGAAGCLGLEAYVARLNSLKELQEEIAAARPVVASLTFAAGELSGSPISATKGHLVLVVGFTREGNVIALDPAAENRSGARRVYVRGEFHRAWRVNKRGLCYLMSPLKGRRLSVGVPVADLMSRRRPPKAGSLHDRAHLSQLLYGETVTLEKVTGDWVRVRADEQLDFLEAGRWQGYPGWMRSEALLFDLPPRPNVVVRTRQALLQKGRDIVMLSVGTRLSRVSENKGASFVELTGGGLGEAPSDGLFTPPERPTPESRSVIIKTAELFLGTSYYWGGRSGVQEDPSIGVDCSGLVSLAYRVHGLDLPRDSHEQKLKSRPIAGKDLLPADLIFLTDSARSKTVTHVLIYTGGDGAIESRKSPDLMLRTSLRRRFDLPVGELKFGEVVTDYSLPKPRRRVIYFGTYF